MHGAQGSGGAGAGGGPATAGPPPLPAATHRPPYQTAGRKSADSPPSAVRHPEAGPSRQPVQ